MVQLNKMLNLKAGSAVKALLMAAESNGPVYVRLLTPGSDSIEYDVVEGNSDVLERAGKSLGVTVTPTQFVVEAKPVLTSDNFVDKPSIKKRVKLNVESEFTQSS
jgi:hypothetical protein